MPTVVPTDSRALSYPPIGALPRNRLASSATGGASPISPPAGDRKGRPYESVARGGQGRAESPSHGCAVPAPFRQGADIVGLVERADVGSELSAASGRSSEVSEWPRSKFPASAVRQRRNFGHRNRVIDPYTPFTDRTS